MHGRCTLITLGSNGGGGWADICDISIATIHESITTYPVACQYPICN